MSVQRYLLKIDGLQFMLGYLYMSIFMKFCALVLELHLPQNFCHTQTDRETGKQTFSTKSQIVFRVSQNV